MDKKVSAESNQLDSAFNILNRFRVVQPKSEVWGAYRPVMRTIFILLKNLCKCTDYVQKYLQFL